MKRIQYISMNEILNSSRGNLSLSSETVNSVRGNLSLYSETLNAYRMKLSLCNETLNFNRSSLSLSSETSTRYKFSKLLSISLVLLNKKAEFQDKMGSMMFGVGKYFLQTLIPSHLRLLLLSFRSYSLNTDKRCSAPKYL